MQETLKSQFDGTVDEVDNKLRSTSSYIHRKDWPSQDVPEIDEKRKC